MIAKLTTPSGRKLRIVTRPTGINFGYVGEVRAANGRIIATTEAQAFPEQALEVGVALARRIK